jgi:glycosyltransferase involved in cell wall biosynthesis
MGGRAHTPSIGFLLEQTLGHVSHSNNLRQTLSGAKDVDIRWRELAFDQPRLRDRLPPRSNWTIRSSRDARAAVRELQRQAPLDALFVHTHVPATLLRSVMASIPTVVSIDATPHQIDALGESYNHRVRSGPLETVKWRLHRDCFQSAASLVAWSQWAADSLVDDYGVDRDRIDVIPPGVVPSQWKRQRPPRESDGIVRVLFVGGDFDRKGGNLLLAAVDQLNSESSDRELEVKVELHLVTTSDVAARPNVHVHRNLTPNSAALIELYHQCDIFALPTRGDCTPLVLAEAAAAGLPSVAADVGAISETVLDGVTGHLVEHNVESLTAALRRLVVDADHRRVVGQNAAEHAERTMDAERNARRILDRLVEHARPDVGRGRVLLSVSGEIAEDLDASTAAGERPLADYVAIAEATGAVTVDRRVVRSASGKSARLIERVGGINLAMAVHIFNRRREIDLVITDGEQIGLPLAALFRLPGSRPKHVMIGHRISVPKKTWLIRALGLARGVDEVLVYSTHQADVARRLFARPGQRVRLIDFMVDSKFFFPRRSLSTRAAHDRPVLCTAGREFRDYPTLIEAVRELDVDLIVASASPWSKRPDNAYDAELPTHVTVTSLTQNELRDQLDASDLVVMPLLPVDFQAGVTTILEAMAMARPVICSSTIGQIDVVVDGENGRYVPPGDVAALRQAIEDLLADPERAEKMGGAGRALVEERADVRAYAATFASIAGWHLGADVAADVGNTS